MDPKLQALLTSAADAVRVIETLANEVEPESLQSSHWARHRAEFLRAAILDVTGGEMPEGTIRDTPDFPEDPEDSPFAEPAAADLASEPRTLWWLNLHEGEGYEVYGTEAEVMDRARELLDDEREAAQACGEWGPDIEAWEIGTMVVTHRLRAETTTNEGAEVTDYAWVRESPFAEPEDVGPDIVDRTPKVGDVLHYEFCNGNGGVEERGLWTVTKSREWTTDEIREPPLGAEASRQRIFQDIEAERAGQDAKWGGPTHDDEHDVLDWVTHIGKHARRAAVVDPAQQRKQMIRVAALAVACVEALDRQGHGQPRELTTEEARDLARHFASRTRNGGPIELTADEREALYAWVRHRMNAEDGKVQEAKAEIDARRAAKGLPPTSRPSATRESKVLAIAIELDLAPWDTKPVLDDDDLAVARALCDAAEVKP